MDKLDPTPKTREQVIARLQEMTRQPHGRAEGHYDVEWGHQEIDELLLGLINDQEITGLVNALERWYA